MIRGGADERNAMPCAALHPIFATLQPYRPHAPSTLIYPPIRVVTSNSTTTNSTQNPVLQRHIAYLPPAVPYRTVLLKPPRTAPLHRAQGLDFHSICSVTCKDALSHIPRIPFMYAGFIVPSFPCYSHDLRASPPVLSLSSPSALQYKQANLAHHLPGTKENKG